MQTATLVDRKPSLPKRKAAKHYHLLEEVTHGLIEGRTTNGLQNVPYQSVEQASRYLPIIDTACQTLGMTKYESLWRMLQDTFPKLQKTQLHMIGSRDSPQAQLAAQQLSGEIPMRIDYLSGNGDVLHHPLLQRVLDPQFAYTYRHAQLWYNVFLDAGKSEPVRWVTDLTGITYRGLPLEQRVVHVLLKTKVCLACAREHASSEYTYLHMLKCCRRTTYPLSNSMHLAVLSWGPRCTLWQREAMRDAPSPWSRRAQKRWGALKLAC